MKIFFSSLSVVISTVVILGNAQTESPKGWEVPVSGRKLRVGVPVAAGFPQFVKVEKDPKTNVSNVTGCYIDVFEKVMAALPYPVPYEYVPFEKGDGSSAGSYDALVYQVFLQKYDAAVGDITITWKRSKYVDFSLPFSEGGVDIVVPITYHHQNSNWIFLKPFTKELWLTAIALFVLTGAALWILEHRTNADYRGPPAQHAGLIFYFPFMSLVFAQRERIVSNLGRLVLVVWLFVVLILNSTYTASLSARLTVERLQPAVTDVKELIRKGKFVGCQKGAFVCDLLVQELGFEKLKIKAYEHPEECEDALSKGNISAFFSVRSYTKFFLSRYCDKYTTLSQTYPTNGFAFVFPMGSPLVADVSRAVVELTENKTISEIEREWIKKISRCKPCNGPDATRGAASTAVSLQSFKTLFGITGGITSICIIVFLMRYLYMNRDLLGRILRSSSATIWSKVGAICRHFDERDAKSFRSSKRDGGDTSVVVPVEDDVEAEAEAPSPPPQ